MNVEEHQQTTILRDNIIKTSEAVILSSTIHGISSIVRTPRIFNKVIWAFFTLASTVGCFFVIVRTLGNYFNYEATTKIVLYHQDKIDFPTVTICNVSLKPTWVNNRVGFQTYIFFQIILRSTHLLRKRRVISYIYSKASYTKLTISH